MDYLKLLHRFITDALPGINVVRVMLGDETARLPLVFYQVIAAEPLSGGLHSRRVGATVQVAFTVVADQPSVAYTRALRVGELLETAWLERQTASARAITYVGETTPPVQVGSPTGTQDATHAYQITAQITVWAGNTRN